MYISTIYLDPNVLNSRNSIFRQFHRLHTQYHPMSRKLFLCIYFLRVYKKHREVTQKRESVSKCTFCCFWFKAHSWKHGARSSSTCDEKAITGRPRFSITVFPHVHMRAMLLCLVCVDQSGGIPASSHVACYLRRIKSSLSPFLYYLCASIGTVIYIEITHYWFKEKDVSCMLVQPLLKIVASFSLYNLLF